jgi:hypothetical protein
MRFSVRLSAPLRRPSVSVSVAARLGATPVHRLALRAAIGRELSPCFWILTAATGLLAMLACGGCNALIGATDPIEAHRDAGGGVDATAGAMDSTPGGMDSTPEAPSPGCTEGAYSCTNGWTLKCVDGGWMTEDPCNSGCNRDSGICGDCPPKRKRCTDAGGAEECRDDGTWGAPTPCQFLCLNDDCTGECTPDASTCLSPSSYKTCDSAARWNTASCMPAYVCHADAAQCVGAVYDVGWDSMPTGAFELTPGNLYMLRLPTLTYSAQVTLFGAVATESGALADLLLYADDGSGSAPTGVPVASMVNNVGLVANQPRTQYVMGSSVDLAAGTYWLGIVVDSLTHLSWAPDMYGVGKTYQYKINDSPYPDLTNKMGTDLSMLDLGIFINVTYTD